MYKQTERRSMLYFVNIEYVLRMYYVCTTYVLQYLCREELYKSRGITRLKRMPVLPLDNAHTCPAQNCRPF